MFYFHARFPIPNLAYPIPNLVEETGLIHKIVNREETDVIHFHQPEFLTSIPLPFVKWMLHRPTILTINGFPGTSWHYGNAMVDLAGLVYTQTVTRFLMRYADKILLYASNLKSHAKKLGVPEEKMIFPPEGITLSVPENGSQIHEGIRTELGISGDEKQCGDDLGN